jgi:phenylalanyl-tRNA synthetase beta subunit
MQNTILLNEKFYKLKKIISENNFGKPVAIAGVMGGLNSEIKESSTHPSQNRRSSARRSVLRPRV